MSSVTPAASIVGSSLLGALLAGCGGLLLAAQVLALRPSGTVTRVYRTVRVAAVLAITLLAVVAVARFAVLS